VRQLTEEVGRQTELQRSVNRDLQAEFRRLTETLAEKTREFERKETWLKNSVERTQLKSKSKYFRQT